MHVYFSSAGDTGRIEKYVNSNISMRIKKVIRRGFQCILEIQKLQNMFSRNGG